MLVEDQLSQFNPISLSDMDDVQLLNRVDSKYILTKKRLNYVLPFFSEHYQCLEIEGKRIASYKSLYFDTLDFNFFFDHHNERSSRYKVRMRKYIDSNLCFFEIKHKKKGRTEKTRIKIDDFEEYLLYNSREFLRKNIPNTEKISPRLWSTFNRITLVNNHIKERVTIDVGLNFHFKGKNNSFEDICIIEVKQDRNDRVSPSRKILRRENVRFSKISKYCIGISMAYPELKSNNFKKISLLINKIRKNAS